MPLYIVCIACMIFIGLMGGVLKVSVEQQKRVEMNPTTVLKFAAIGFFYTFLFDIVTNIILAYFYYGGNVILALMLGLPFMIIHLISNTILFAFLIIPVYNTVISI